MKDMGWSWADLMAAPADLLDELAVRLAAEAEMTMKRRDLGR